MADRSGHSEPGLPETWVMERWVIDPFPINIDWFIMREGEDFILYRPNTEDDMTKANPPPGIKSMGWSETHAVVPVHGDINGQWKLASWGRGVNRLGET